MLHLLLPTCMASYLGKVLASLFGEYKGGLTVDVTADTGVAADGLPVLTPETICRLRVDKAIWVRDRCNVEVELVHEGLDVRI
jgi:hypothetical protein